MGAVPELKKFFGIMPLKTGLLTVVVIMMTLDTVFLTFHIGKVTEILNARQNFPYDENSRETEHVNGESNRSNAELIIVSILLGTQAVRLIFILVLLIGILKNKKQLVQIYLIFYSTMWACVMIAAFVCTRFFNRLEVLMIVIILLTQAYMILVIRSLYIQMNRQDSAISFDNGGLNEESHDHVVIGNRSCDAPPIYEESVLPVNVPQHDVASALPPLTSAISANSYPASLSQDPEEPVVATEQTSPVVIIYVCSKCKEQVENAKDQPVIYDFNQLNASSSLVVENGSS